MVYQRGLVQHIVLPEQYALTYYRQPRNRFTYARSLENKTIG
jgi:hypothetical protein